MFEPRVFNEKAQGQDALILALLDRDMEAFEQALADPDVDPNYWYGKPYWSTCLQLAAKTPGCEAFVLALLRVGAGNLRLAARPRPSDAASRTAAERIAKLIADAGGEGGLQANGDLDEFLEALAALAGPAGGCVCGAQAAASAAAALPRGAEPAAAAAAGSPPPRAEGVGGGGVKHEHMLGLWLRETNRELRETAEHMQRELRVVAERVEQLGERVAAMERAQQRTNDLLLHLKR